MAPTDEKDAHVQEKRARRDRYRWLAVALIGLSLAGCGYRLAGGGSLPEHIKILVIVPFENRTARPEIEQRVTEELARQFSKRGRYEVVTDRTNADAMLEGAVTHYRTTPVEFGDESLATRVEAAVTLQATLRDLASDTVLWSQTGLVFREQYDVKSREDVSDREILALDEIARGAAAALVNSILEGF